MAGLGWVGRVVLTALAALSAALPARASPDPAALFQQHCVACHGLQRLGGSGPALLAESLERLRPADVAGVITDGRPGSAMLPFKGKLSGAEVTALAQWLQTPTAPAPQWTEADIRASRVETPGAAAWPDRPRWPGDPMQLFVVVEAADHHVSLVDGAGFKLIHRFASRQNLYAAPKFSADGRYAYFGSRDGWVTKFDLWNLAVVAEVRAALSMRNIALSSDGKWLLAAGQLPHALALLDADLRLVKTLATKSRDRKATSRVSAVHDAASRQSFIVPMRDMAEIWEISYNPNAEDIYDGLVHDYRMGEGIPMRGFHNPKRSFPGAPIEQLAFDAKYTEGAGTTRAAQGVAPQTYLVNFDVRKRIATLPLEGRPHLGGAVAFEWQGRQVLAAPNLQRGEVTVLDLATWQPLRTIATPGPGYFLRSHAKTPYVWSDSMLSTNAKDSLTVFDKRTLQVVTSVREAGRTLGHVEFSADGRHALAALREDDGALIVFDATTFKELTRLPMRRPLGIYNVGNRAVGGARTPR